MEESRVSRAANKILFLTKREELLITEDEQDKVIDTLFEEERQMFTQKIRSSLEEENRYMEEATKRFANDLKSLLETKFQSFPDEVDWLPRLENTSGLNLKDLNVKELKSKGIEVVYTKNGFQLRERKLKDKPKRKAEDRSEEKAEDKVGDKAEDKPEDKPEDNVEDNVEDRENAEPEARSTKATRNKTPVASVTPVSNDENVSVNGGSDSGKVLRKRRRI